MFQAINLSNRKLKKLWDSVEVSIKSNTQESIYFGGALTKQQWVAGFLTRKQHEHA